MTTRSLKIALAVIAGLAAMTALTSSVRAVRAQDDATQVQVDAVRIEPLNQTFTVIGRLVARQRGDVAARIAGPVAEIHVQIGDRVRTGDVIAVVDRKRPAWRHEVAVAEVEESKADQANAEARHAMAEAGVARAEARLALARQAHARLERLRTSAAFSQARLDDLAQEVVVAVSEVDFARAEVFEALSLIDQSRARLMRSRANLKNAADDLDDTAVRAPYDGVVTLRHTEVGAYLEIGAKVVTLVNDRDIEIEADVPYNRLDALTPDIEVSFRLDNGVWHRAVVRAVGVEENSRTRTRVVRFSPDFNSQNSTGQNSTGQNSNGQNSNGQNSDGQNSNDMTDNLANGQSVALALPVGPPRDIVSVHKDAIIRGVDGAAVFVVADGTAERRLVSLGEAVGGRFEVLSGLRPGELVVVRGNERLRPGQAVVYDGSS